MFHWPLWKDDSTPDIHDQLAVAPIDEPNKNGAVEVLIKELEIDPDGGSDNSDTYNMCDINNQHIITYHSKFLQAHFKLKVSQDNDFFPDIYWIVKLHGNTIKARFIAVSLISLLKDLVQWRASVFKVIHQIFQRYNNKSRSFSCVKVFWTVLDNEAVINMMKKWNKRGKYESA